MRLLALIATAAVLICSLSGNADARSRRSSGRSVTMSYHAARTPAPADSYRTTTRSTGVVGSAAPGTMGDCQMTSPCFGPRGERYYFTASGAKRYLPR